MDTPVLANKQKLILISCVRTLVIGIDGERESKESMLLACFDEEWKIITTREILQDVQQTWCYLRCRDLFSISFSNHKVSHMLCIHWLYLLMILNRCNSFYCSSLLEPIKRFFKNCFLPVLLSFSPKWLRKLFSANFLAPSHCSSRIGLTLFIDFIGYKDYKIDGVVM